MLSSPLSDQAKAKRVSTPLAHRDVKVKRSSALASPLTNSRESVKFKRSSVLVTPLADLNIAYSMLTATYREKEDVAAKEGDYDGGNIEGITSHSLEFDNNLPSPVHTPSHDFNPLASTASSPSTTPSHDARSYCESPLKQPLATSSSSIANVPATVATTLSRYDAHVSSNISHSRPCSPFGSRSHSPPPVSHPQPSSRGPGGVAALAGRRRRGSESSESSVGTSITTTTHRSGATTASVEDCDGEHLHHGVDVGNDGMQVDEDVGGQVKYEQQKDGLMRLDLSGQVVETNNVGGGVESVHFSSPLNDGDESMVQDTCDERNHNPMESTAPEYPDVKSLGSVTSNIQGRRRRKTNPNNPKCSIL